MPTLGENIQRLRKMRFCTQQELADFLHVSQQTVCRYEADESEPSLTTIFLISVKLSISPYELLHGIFQSYNAAYYRGEYDGIIRQGGQGGMEDYMYRDEDVVLRDLKKE